MIAVIGLGFVGLTSALGLCEKGHGVHGYDADPGIRLSLRNEQIPFREPSLQEALVRHSGDKFRLAENMEEAVRDSRVIFFCVGTPASADGSVDLNPLLEAIDQSLEAADRNSYPVLVIKSTVPPSTTRTIILPHLQKHGLRVGQNAGLATNPEFLREGTAWSDFINPDRIVIGAEDPSSIEVLASVYRPFHRPVHIVSTNTAEFIKYGSNSLLATLVSFSNEMSMVAHAVGDIDIKQAFSILRQDRRWGEPHADMASFLHPGCGYGGYCLPKDVQAMRAVAESYGSPHAVLGAVIDTNQAIKVHLFNRLAACVHREEWIGVLGLAFKPGTDDVRDSPARDFIEMLLQKQFKKIVAYDPMARERFARQYGFDIEYARSLEEMTNKAKNLVVLTAWPEFKSYLRGREGLTVFDFRYYL